MTEQEKRTTLHGEARNIFDSACNNLRKIYELRKDKYLQIYIEDIRCTIKMINGIIEI